MFEQKYGRTLEEHLMNPQSLNSYSYANNNPVNLSDPNGEIVPLVALGIIATVGFIAWDSYDVYSAFNDPNSTNSDKGIAVGFLALNAIPGAGPVKGSIKGIKTADKVANAVKVTNKMNDVIRVGDTVAGLRVSDHAEKQFMIRNMNIKQIETALNNGVKYIDTKTNNLVHVIGERGKGGYTIVTDQTQKVLVTVENFVQKLSNSRYIKK